MTYFPNGVWQYALYKGSHCEYLGQQMCLERNFHIPKATNCFLKPPHSTLFFVSSPNLYALPTPSQLFLLLVPQRQRERCYVNKLSSTKVLRFQVSWGQIPWVLHHFLSIISNRLFLALVYKNNVISFFSFKEKLELKMGRKIWGYCSHCT